MFRIFEPGYGTDPDAVHKELYVRDLRLGTVTKAATPLPGTKTVLDSFRATMTADNRWVFFASDADNLVPGDTNGVSDIFRRDRDLRADGIERVGVAADGSQTSWPSSPPVRGRARHDRALRRERQGLRPQASPGVTGPPPNPRPYHALPLVGAKWPVDLGLDTGRPPARRGSARLSCDGVSR
ncbi:hypothetical protein [Streptomyces syringium]|uniref:hypothetical protein n=1 Tax=Streptomyces syringium TaxID=76729 RepID=UPI003414EC9B